MAKAHTSWRVLPHGPIEKLSERVWRIEGQLPNMPMKRVMTIARRSDGGVVVHNAIAVGDREMAEITAWGPVVTLAVPNGYHRLDAGVFHERFPAARVVCPPGARKKVAEVVPVTVSYLEEPVDSAVSFEVLDGTKGGEGAMIVKDAAGTTLVLNDIVFNMPHVSGFTGFMLRRVTASTGGPRISRIARWFLARDKPALRTHLEKLAGLPELRRAIVSHHQVIEQPAGVLRDLAATL
jgi:hypothetical protein